MSDDLENSTKWLFAISFATIIFIEIYITKVLWGAENVFGFDNGIYKRKRQQD